MITLRRMNLKERLRRRLFPNYRRQREEEMRLTIRWLLDHPEEPCFIEGKYIPNGFGGPLDRVSALLAGERDKRS